MIFQKHFSHLWTTPMSHMESYDTVNRTEAGTDAAAAHKEPRFRKIEFIFTVIDISP